MLEPDSAFLLAAILIGCVASLYFSIRVRRLYVKIICGVLVIALGMTSGMALVNDHFGYYRNWDALWSDLSGSYAAFAPTTATSTSSVAEHGVLEQVTFGGATSHISRNGFVYLPPQYEQPAYAQFRFPALELIGGSPGGPNGWVVQLQVVKLYESLLAAHLIGPMILVIPTTNEGNHYEECVDGPYGLDDTYVSTDVPADVIARFRVTADRAQWGIAGYSSGGYCAANLALRHRGKYGAAAALDGYFRPTDGPAADALGRSSAAEAANDPYFTAQHLAPGQGPLPAFWIAAGSAVRSDLVGAQHFVQALEHAEQVTYVEESNGGHTFYTWYQALPHMLSWMWAQLAPPNLRLLNPLSGALSSFSLPVFQPGPSPSPAPDQPSGH